ncbi:MAG: tyrosine--tRNA ligase [Alphaproteobacteria bacterium]|nr:MAG: tyrosine--tRNA ligase [Alphaproteobacteria bacterium]
MTSVNSEFLQVLIERGFLHHCTDLEGLDQKLCAGPVTAYNGFDPTGPSLHVGHLLPIMLLRWYQKCGHKPIVLIGGGTAKVGDPSGKDETRRLLTETDIENNIVSIRETFGRFLTFGDGPDDAVLVNNADWLDELKYIPFLRDIGRHFTINRMLTFDSVKLRLEREHPLTFLEFNYMILQAYDFLELYRNHGCLLQLGGSDQWGNIVNGVELGRRLEQATLYGLTVPLITTADGAKMGKTAKGAVWLKEDMLSAYDYWQFWRNTADADVGRFLRLFTELPVDEIRRLEALEGAELNEAKKILATEATTLCHGAEAAHAAAETARRTFEEGQSGANLPTVEIPAADLATGIAILDLYVQAGLCASKGEARRLVRQGGARVNDRQVRDELATIDRQAIGPEGHVKLSAGKKRHALVKPV